ncbi:DNA polymerase alpha catalytic subunit [Symbiodinium microadriaticum]|uniref:DNA polymerase alpha catalytic subunit n=1 Tax=Symbiodinium microadriaticum TaxID=2951 RepID=A0A1Q9DSH8_SYMMI|nr:DNA polymerase alpha catalytic subunit [Symbiodinium microadriaticum]
MILVETDEDVRFSIMTVELVAAHWPARQMSVVIDIKLVENDAFEATLEFGVRLLRPRNAVLGHYLHTCRVTVADDDTFPTNRNADKLREDSAAEIQPVVLWSEYLKMSLKDRKVRVAATYNLLTDQVRNLAYLWQVMLTKYLIDQVLADEPQPFFTDPIMPQGREERVWLTIAFSFVPHAVMLVLNRLKAERRIQGMVVNQLQGNLLRKFLNYNEDSRDSVSTSDLAMAITRDVPELVEHGFMGIFELVENLGLVIVLGILMLAQSQLSALTPICFFLIPLAMLIFIYIRHPETERRDRLVFQRQTEMLILVHQVTDNTRLITDYFQRPTMVVSFNGRVAECNKATTLATMFRVTNSEFAPFMTTVVIAIYVIFHYASVVDKTITIGEFLTSVAVWRSIGSAYQNAYKDMLQIQQAAAPLLNVIHYMNLPVDTTDRMLITREMQEFGKTAQMKAHHQLFRSLPANSPFVEESSCVSFNGEKLTAKYPQDLIQIYADNINFAYPARTGGGIDLLRNATFKIPQGQLVAVAGPKGCGKKTLLDFLPELIAGILLPTGHTKLFVPPHLRVLHVSKDPQLLPEITLFENLTFGPSDGQDEEEERVLAICRRLGLSADAVKLVEASIQRQGDVKKSKAADKLRVVERPAKSGSAQSSALRELQEKNQAPENSLPFTEKCLLHLARALVMNPEVLILHKPLEHFDYVFARRVVEILREFVDLRGLEKPRETLHLRSPRTCIFSVGHLENLEDVDTLLQVTNKQVEAVDLDSLCRLKQEVGQLFHVLDKNVDNLLDREEFMGMAEEAPASVELFGIKEGAGTVTAKHELNKIFDKVDDSQGGKIDQEEFVAFIRLQFDDQLAEAVQAMKNPVGASQKIAEIQSQKAKRKQLEFASSPGYKHLDAWDSPEIPAHTAILGFPVTSKKLPITADEVFTGVVGSLVQQRAIHVPVPLTRQLTSLAGNLWNGSLQNKRAERNELLLCHEFHSKKFVLPDKESISQKKRRLQIEGGQGISAGFDDPEEPEAQAGGSRKGKVAYSGGLVLEPQVPCTVHRCTRAVLE